MRCTIITVAANRERAVVTEEFRAIAARPKEGEPHPGAPDHLQAYEGDTARDVLHDIIDTARAAVAKLSSPDPDSRTPDYEGRRIETIEGGELSYGGQRLVEPVSAVVDGSAAGPSANLRQAVSIAEALSPCVLWIDEIEKFFADEARKGEGAATRVMGAFVTWLQEKTAPVFVFATANQIDLLAPEILRKGRFDEVFFVDLPTDDERRVLGAFRYSRNLAARALITQQTALLGVVLALAIQLFIVYPILLTMLACVWPGMPTMMPVPAS